MTPSPSAFPTIVSGRPSPRWWRRTAVIDESEIIAHVKSHLAHYKAPKRVFAVDTLERAANGKVDYKRWTQHAEANA